MMFFLILGIYFVGAVCFTAWDAYIGFGVEFDGDDWPPMAMAVICWPTVILAAMVAFCFRFLIVVKRNRISKEKEQIRIRISAEEERSSILKQIEEEMQYVQDQDQNSA